MQTGEMCSPIRKGKYVAFLSSKALSVQLLLNSIHYLRDSLQTLPLRDAEKEEQGRKLLKNYLYIPL
jgi:hypothetical protein